MHANKLVISDLFVAERHSDIKLIGSFFSDEAASVHTSPDAFFWKLVRHVKSVHVCGTFQVNASRTHIEEAEEKRVQTQKAEEQTEECLFDMVRASRV